MLLRGIAAGSRPGQHTGLVLNTIACPSFRQSNMSCVERRFLVVVALVEAKVVCVVVPTVWTVDEGLMVV